VGNVDSDLADLFILNAEDTMKKGFAYFNAACILLLITAVFFLTGCIREVIYQEDDRYTPFPEAQILGASFYYQVNNQDVSGDEAGMISKNEDGTYQVKMKRRSPPSLPSAMYIMGSFEFSDFYKIVCTFPDDPTIIDKPYRVYACASRYMDGNTDADYPTAVDLIGEAAFRSGVAAGTFEMTNEGINYLNPDPRGRPYITVFLYLYFNNVSNPDDYYEFTLDFVGGANGYVPASKVTRAEIYRSGDANNKFVLEAIDEEVTDIGTGEISIETTPILARYNHRFDSIKIKPAVPSINTSSLHIELKVPDDDVGKQIEFEVRGAGLFSGDGENQITRDMNVAGRVLAGTGQAEQTGVVEEVRVVGNPPTYYYKVKARTVRYANLFGEVGTGVKFVISGTEQFANIDRFTCGLFVPEKYVGE